jgi:cell division septation protein DedD
MTEPGRIRNLEQLEEEEDDDERMPRGASVALIVLGGSCIVFGALALGGRSTPQAAKPDPLGELVSQRGRPATAAPAPPPDLTASDVTFPRILSDGDKPPTVLVAVHGPAPSATVASASAPSVALGASGGPAAAPVPTQPPPPTDRLPVVPLPAQAVLEATPIVKHPRDALTKVAKDTAQLDAPAGADAAPAGHEGGYQLQVSSFRAQAEAQGFADQLRTRGHKAYVVEAHVPGRGTWFRVRVGPFPTQHSAAQYRTGFEAREHVVPFVVPPETTARAEPATRQ